MRHLKNFISSIQQADQLSFAKVDDYKEYWDSFGLGFDMAPATTEKKFSYSIWSWERYGLPLSGFEGSNISGKRDAESNSGYACLIMPVRCQMKYETTFGVERLEAGADAYLLHLDSMLTGNESGSAMCVTLESARLADTVAGMLGGRLDQAVELTSRSQRLAAKTGKVNYFSAVKQISDIAATFTNQPEAIVKIGLDDLAYRLVGSMVIDTLDDGSNKKSFSNEGFSMRVVDGVIEWINAHLEDVITMTKLERISGLSSRSLQMMFAKHLATTPMSFVREQRLMRAYQILRKQPNKPVVEVARECGYPNPSMFSARYRKRFGFAPSETRH